MNIIILGPQGSGKGTQAELLAQKYNLEHIDVGKTLREAAKLKTPLGKEIYEILNVKRTLVPNEIFEKVFKLKLALLSREQGTIVDGAPRMKDQIKNLEEALLETGRKIDKVIFVNISDAEAVERISKRWICQSCHNTFIMGLDVKREKDLCPKCGGQISQRADDTPEGVKKRLEVFKEETLPVIEYYKKQDLVLEINGEQPIEKVFADIQNHITHNMEHGT
ncbi:MAG: nucleoside monophosphate kinase [Candidatus Moranbacteria bacterium]|nr:nucleoside monophosphate kinase [Candidatus Moranbacteria bacterium]